MSISELNKNVYGQIALYLEHVHPFAQGSKGCQKIAEDSFYPALFNAYSKLEHVKLYTGNLQDGLSSAQKVRAVYKQIVDEMRATGGGEAALAKFKKPRSLHPLELKPLAQWNIQNRDANLECVFPVMAKGLPEAKIFLDGLKENNRANAIRDWMSKNPQHLLQLREFAFLSATEKRPKLTAIPQEMACLGSLTTLNLTGHKFVDFSSLNGALPHLHYLSFDRTLVTTVPQVFDKFFDLTYLRLSNSRLTEIPSSICNLKRLEMLFLNKNKIAVLPREINKLTNLTWLDLSYNSMTTLPHELNDLKLNRFEIENNPIEAVPQALKDSNLEVIRDNPLIKSAKALPAPVPIAKVPPPPIPTLCDQILEAFSSVWSWLVDSAKAFFAWLSS